MCGRCANLENRVGAKRVEAIRATDRYRWSKEHEQDFKRMFGESIEQFHERKRREDEANRTNNLRR